MDNEFFENLDKKDFITYAKEAIGQTPLEIKLKKLDKNDKNYNLIMTAKDFDNNRCPDYWGKIGDVLYGYNKIRNKHQ